MGAPINKIVSKGEVPIDTKKSNLCVWQFVNGTGFEFAEGPRQQAKEKENRVERIICQARRADL